MSQQPPSTPTSPASSNSQALQESQKPYPHWQYERDFWSNGLLHVAGIDEAGRGAWAGPVTVAAVILPPCEQDYPFRDSKKLSSDKRQRYAQKVKEVAVSYAVVHVFGEEIAQHNILGATHLAALRAIEQLTPHAQALITDYLKLVQPLPLVAPAKADSHSYSVAAASLLAKTARDSYMIELAEQYPEYRFASHKGYGSAQHRQALEQHGVSPVHRRTFAPIARLLEKP